MSRSPSFPPPAPTPQPPTHRFVRLLRLVVDPAAPPSARQRAARALAALDRAGVAALAQHRDGQALLALLQGGAAALGTAGDLGTTAQSAVLYVQMPAVPAADLIMLTDLDRVLVPRIAVPPTAGSSWTTRLRAAVRAQPITWPVEVAACAGLPWSLSNPTAAIDVLDRAVGDDPHLVAARRRAFWGAAVAHVALEGVPPRLGRALWRVSRHSRSTGRWLSRVARTIDWAVAAEPWDALDDRGVARVFLGLRVDIGLHAIRAEILDPQVLGLAHLYAIVRVLHTAGLQDLATVFRESGADPDRATVRLRGRLASSVPTEYERIVRLALAAPPTQDRGALSQRERHGLARLTRGSIGRHRDVRKQSLLSDILDG